MPGTLTYSSASRALSSQEVEGLALKAKSDAEDEELKLRAEHADRMQREVTDRLREIESILPFFSPQEGMQRVGQLRAMSGVIAPSTNQMAHLLRTSTMANMPPELVALALQAGAAPGQRGGGLRLGADGMLDVGTIRHQMETYALAGITGAPAIQGVQANTQRQMTLAGMGVSTDFDRDAMMLRNMQRSGVSMYQAPTLMGEMSDMRMSALERYRAPGKQMMASLLEAAAYMRAGTQEEAGRILATESMSEQIQRGSEVGALSDPALSFIASRLTPGAQSAGLEWLRGEANGASEGSAVASGSTTLPVDTQLASTIANRPARSSIGSSMTLSRQAAISQFRMTLDTAAKQTVAMADSLAALAAAAGNSMFGD